jgi:hypothetical protein
VISPAGITSQAALGTPTIQIRSYVYYTWAEIALEQEELARVARGNLLDATDSAVGSEHLHGEYRAAMQAVAAAAHSIDGLYGVFAPPYRREGPRQRVILERLKLRFALGKKGHTWLPQFDRLDDLRDSAVHPGFVAREPEPHPTGSNVSHENSTYAAEAAVRAVDLLLDVLTTCVASPKPAETDAVTWAKGASDGIAKLTARSTASRQQHPLRTV